MRVLVACECSGVVREAFHALGHDAVSCDLKPSEVSGPHIIGDVLDLIYPGRHGSLHRTFDLMIAHPPCTYLSSSGLHWNSRIDGRADKTADALWFVEVLMAAPIERICIENPQGCIGTRIRPADQYIQPYQFGHNASKRTGLWLKGLPLLRPTRYIEPRMVDGKPRWANQTDSGQNRLGPSPTRSADRARTYTGIANAMAEQWSIHA